MRKWLDQRFRTSSRRSRLLLPAVIVANAVILSTPGSVLAQEWTEFANLDDRFTCNFPGEPEVIETTWTSEYGADLPARVYRAQRGPSQFSVTVADYAHAERILVEKASGCPPGAERCSGGGSTGEGYWRHDVAGALIYATWTFVQRDATVTHLGFNSVDRVEGYQLHLGTIGSPVVNKHRSLRPRSSHESAGWSRRYARRAVARCSAWGVREGIRPLGGSTISDVRRDPMVVVPRSSQKSL